MTQPLPILKILSRRADQIDVTPASTAPRPSGCADVGELRPDVDPSFDGVATAETADVLAGQRVVRGVTERLLHAGPTDLDAEIDHALRDLGGFLDMDRVYVFALEGRTIRNTHEWCAPGITPEIDHLQALPVEMIAHWTPTLSAGQPRVISDVPGLPLDSPERAHLVEQGICSLIVVPMIVRDDFIGFVGFDAVRAPRTFTPFEVGLLQWISAVLTSAVMRRRADTKAERAERRLAALTRYATDFILILSDDGHIRFASDSWSEMGVAPEDLVGLRWRDYVHHDDLQPLRELARRSSEPGSLDRVTLVPDMRIKDGHGGWRWLSGSISDVRHDDVVGGIVVNLHDVTERRGVQDQLAHDARHDPLTGLGNRAMLADELERACRRARRQRSSLALVFLDLDHFKLVNDGHGHAVGDEVLVEIARRLSSVVRSTDVVARFGGDEFVALIDGFDSPEEVERLVIRLERALDEPVAVAGQAYRVTASMGVVLAEGERLDPIALLRDADSAMYRAKESGRDRVVTFDDSIRSGVLRRLALVQRLPSALRQGLVTLAFQPVVDLRTGRTVGAEALARWEDEELGAVSPAEFVPVLEELGLAPTLTNVVVDGAVAALTSLPAVRTVSINLTPSQLLDPSLSGLIADRIREQGVVRGGLCVEVTESTLMADPDGVAEVLCELRSLGVTTALDDFGTGYSSLAMLRELPIDLLKIDRSFVRRVHIDDRDRRLVDAVIGLASDFGMEPVAEGVELVEQRIELIEAGCRYGQGFLFGRAMPLAEFTVEASRG